MDSIGAQSREVEKPKTVTEKRTALILRLHDRRTRLTGQYEACRQMYGERIPITEWLQAARNDISAALEELERTRR